MMESPEKEKDLLKSFGAPMFGGIAAGATVCTALYPLDTLKTRLQSQHGFYKSGGFKGVYRGCLTVAVGSMPACGIFFVSYEATKSYMVPLVAPQYTPLVYMFAASISEVLCCAVKVPVEIAKQRKQTYVGTDHKSSFRILATAYQTEGFRRGLYRGFLSTVIRDLPFSFIELPIWEGLKALVRGRNDGQITGFQSAICGGIAAFIGGALTTPLDLAKTRVMLAEASLPARDLRIGTVLADIYLRTGLRGLFAGLAPRTVGIVLGGFIFYGVYEDSKAFFERYCENR